MKNIITCIAVIVCTLMISNATAQDGKNVVFNGNENFTLAVKGGVSYNEAAHPNAGAEVAFNWNTLRLSADGAWGDENNSYINLGVGLNINSIRDNNRLYIMANAGIGQQNYYICRTNDISVETPNLWVTEQLRTRFDIPNWGLQAGLRVGFDIRLSKKKNIYFTTQGDVVCNSGDRQLKTTPSDKVFLKENGYGNITSGDTPLDINVKLLTLRLFFGFTFRL